ncbi:hypothetical protein ACIRN4_06245 [Pimelobacter simplex]|uniref:hypothetical protein n=1 Tax=Nocardioides simplex TaxID=2045 RepID=UPI003807E4B1
MPWFKVDDTFAMHEKVMAAGNSAIGLWVRAGAWSMQQLTDGFVPDHVLRVLGTPKERRLLVEVSLWDEAEGGINFRSWSERQPTKEQVEAARQAAAERQRHARERAKSRRESQRDGGVSHGPPDPTRPDPTPLPTEVDRTAKAAKPKRATQRPADFRPAQAHVELAQQLGIDLRAEWQQFCDHHDARGSTFKNWPAALNTWIRNAAKFGRSRPAGATTRQQADQDMFDRQMARAEAREAGAKP